MLGGGRGANAAGLNGSRDDNGVNVAGINDGCGDGLVSIPLLDVPICITNVGGMPAGNNGIVLCV